MLQDVASPGELIQEVVNALPGQCDDLQRG